MPVPVSVIITCFNLQRYIGEAIASVRAQDYPGEVEIIVVDDASTDGSADVVATFSDVRLVRLAQNGGVLLATLAGIAAASHDLLFFLDGDDRWRPGKLAATAACFEDPAVALATHDLRYIDGEGEVVAHPSLVDATMRAVPEQGRSAAVREGILALGDYVWLGSAFAVHRGRGRVDEFARWARQLPDPRRTYQDWPLAYWVASLPGMEGAYVPAKLFDYRVHGSNYSGDASTPERVQRNLVKALNTTEAMRWLALERNLPPSHRRQVERRCAFLRYQMALIEGRMGTAARRLPALLPDLRQRRILLKEAVRFLAIAALGPDRFQRLASGRTFLRRIRPS